jgi:hypothetical protein
MQLGLSVRFGANTPSTPGQSDPLVAFGNPDDTRIVSARSAGAGAIKFLLLRKSQPELESPPIFIEPDRVYQVDLFLGKEGLRLVMQGFPIWEQVVSLQAPDRVRIGIDSLQQDPAGAHRFSGAVRPHLDKNFRLAITFGNPTPSQPPGDPILTTGKAGSANIFSVISPAPGYVKFVLDRWGLPLVASGVVQVEEGKEHTLEIGLAADRVQLFLNDRLVSSINEPMGALDPATIGENNIGASTANAKFSGRIRVLP